MYVGMCICMYDCDRECVWENTGAYVHMSANPVAHSLCTLVCVYLYMYKYMFIHVVIHMFIYVCVHTCIYIHTYVSVLCMNVSIHMYML